MELQFIQDNPNGIGSSDRHLIRSHVMQGKNALLFSDLCLTTFPQELDSKSKSLMHRWFFDISDVLFPPQFCAKFDIVKSVWVNCILADEAYFHCTLAISAPYVDFYRRKPGVSTKNLHYISQAYALVQHDNKLVPYTLLHLFALLIGNPSGHPILLDRTSGKKLAVPLLANHQPM
ncbi:hypothetical protein BDW74DRAFT_179800 [Aspergillus multicolor]|uniref:uncharacterized protein n=1 Tax=Aspergillus multicolor TaxID=41759 RepID=UPI003CCC9A37